ncbi:MAG: hypothetical protein R6V85_00600 [Polyangia bacterium]
MEFRLRAVGLLPSMAAGRLLGPILGAVLLAACGSERVESGSNEPAEPRAIQPDPALTEDRDASFEPPPAERDWFADLPEMGNSPIRPLVYAIFDEKTVIRKAPSLEAAGVAALRAPDEWDPFLASTGNGAGHGVLARVFQREGRYLLVETHPERVRGAPCHPMRRFSPYSLRGYVETDRALIVLKKEVDLSFDDGTSLHLPAGVVLRPSGNRFAPVLRGFHLVPPPSGVTAGRWFHAETGASAGRSEEQSEKVPPLVETPLTLVLDGGKSGVRIERARYTLNRAEPVPGLETIQNECFRITGRRPSRAKKKALLETAPIGLGNTLRIGYGGGGSCSWSSGTPSSSG